MERAALRRFYGIHPVRIVLIACVSIIGSMARAEAQVVMGSGAGGPPNVRVIDEHGDRTLMVYEPSFLGGVRVAMGDVDGDGTADIIAAPGPGGVPQIRIFSGVDLSEISSFLAYDPSFMGGVFVAAGDVDGDGRADIITGAGPGGGAHVIAYSGADLSYLVSFLAYQPDFAGGVFVAAGDFDNDGFSDIVTGAGPGGGPHVTIRSPVDLSYLATFFAYQLDFPGGVSVAAGDMNGDGRVDLMTGAGPGGGPHVMGFDGTNLDLLFSFMAFGDGSGVSIGSIGDGINVRFTSAAETTFTVGEAGSFTVTTQGGPKPVLTVTGTLPAGVTFVDNDDRTGTLSGTPDPGTGGAYPVVFTATPPIGNPSTQNFTLKVNQAPTITSAAAATFNVGTFSSFTITTTGFPAPVVSLSGGTLPAGITLVDNGNGTATLSGTPAAGTAGPYALEFTASNGVPPDAVQSFALTITDGPAITSANATTFTVGSAGAFTVTTTGSLPMTIGVSGTLPAGVTFADNGNGTATLIGTPASGTGGIYPLVITATNSSGTATQNFTLTVNEAPAITSAASTTFTVGSAGTFTVTTSGFPAPTLSMTGTLPGGVSFVDNGNGTATLSGTPDPGTGGTYALTFTAANGVIANATQNFTLTVNQAPAITSANATTFTVGTPGTFTVTTTGFPLAAITRTGTALPANLTFVDNGNGTGTLSGTPAAGTGGTYTFTFTAANGVLPDAVQSFTLTVHEAPAITSATSVSFTVGAAGSFTVTTTGFPPPTIAIGGATLPAGVTFVDNGNGTGTLSGTPELGTGGTYAITFTATNAVGTSPVQNFTLTVTDPIVFTSANATTFTEGIAGTFAVTTTGSPTPTLAVTGTLPGGVTFTDNGNGTATLAGIATLGGTFPLTFTATNVNGPVTQNFTLTVIEVNDAPSFVLAGNPPAVNEDAGPQSVASFATSISAGPPNEAGQVLTFEVTANTNTGLFTTQPAVSATGTLTYTSAPNAFGTAIITLVLHDNGGTANGGVDTSAPQQFTITVNPVNDPPLVAGETFDVLGNTELRVDMTAGTTPHTTETTSNPSTVKGVLDNDADPESDPITVTAITGCGDATAPFDCTLPDGAVIHVEATGEFSFTPGAGDTTASFTYTVTDTPAFGLAASVQGTVTFTIVEMVWYVKNDAAAGGTGTSIAPLNALTTLNGAGGAGDVDDGSDYIFVDFGDGTSTGQTGGLELEVGQHLLGEFVGLSIPVNLNGNGSPTVLVPTPAGDACSGGPCRPLISNTTGNAVTITEAMVAEVRGFRLAGGSAGNAIDVTTNAPLTGSSSLLISANVFEGAGQEGLDVTMIAGTTGTLALAVTANSWNAAGTHAGFAVDIVRLAGTLHLDFSGNTNILSTGVGAVVINGGAGGAASTVITGFANNSVHGNTAGGGVGILNATFDATPGGGINQVNAGTLAIGASGNPVGSAGMSIGSAGNPALGNVSFTDLDVFATTFGLMANGTGGSLTVAVAPGVGTISAAGGAAVDVTAAAIDLQLSSLTSTVAADSGVTLTSVSGTFSAPSGSTITKNGGSGAAFSVDNSAAGTTVLSSTYGGTINNVSGTGGSVLVNTADSGSTLSFTGAITDNPGTGISLTSNTGATMQFSGGLTLNGTATRFSATGGGTVTVTGTNTIGATTPPTTVAALTVTSTTIGVSGMTFRSISANGSPNGIVLSNTGTAGGLSVTGNGGSCTSATPTCTGGRIQNTVGADNSTATPTGTGIVLNNTRNVSLSLIRIDNHSNYAIRGTSVDGFSLANSLVDGANGTNVSTPFNDGSLVFFGVTGVSSGMTGTSSITNSTIQGGFQRNIAIDNSIGTLNLTVSGNTIRRTSDAAGDDGFFLEADTTANVTVSITNNTFARHGGDHINLTMVNSAVMDATITGNTLNGNYTGTPEGNHPIGLGQGILLFGATFNGTFTYDVSNNTIKGNRQGGSIHVNKGSGTATFSGTIENNIIGDAAIVGSGSAEAFGIIVGARGAGGSHTTLINNNQIRQYFDRGIVLQAGEGSAALNATVTNNTVSNFADAINSLHGIHSDNGILAGDSNAVCLAISGNSVATAGNEAQGGADIRLRRATSGTVTVRLPGLSGTTNAAATALLQANNPTATTISVTGDGFSGGAACPLPQ